NDTSPTPIYTLSLHDALPIFKEVTPFLYYIQVPPQCRDELRQHLSNLGVDTGIHWQPGHWFTLFKDCKRGSLDVTDKVGRQILSDRKSTRLNSSHSQMSYAVF